MITLQNIQKSYTMGDNVVHALQGVSLTIEKGDFIAIMGPSGSGKSTLAHIIGLLDVPTSGSYQLHGQEISKLSEDELALLRREEVGFIFQQFNLLPRMSALDNVALPLMYSQKDNRTDQAKNLLEKVGLGTRILHKPNEMSGGQQQRVAIARSLINQPNIILADEPTGNLDSESEKEIMGILKKLNAQGITVIVITHEESIAREAKRIIRMRDGQIQSDERVQAVSPQKDLPAKHALPPRTHGIVEHMKEGFKTLMANPLRTGLSILGILIGVAAVVAMMALGRGAQEAIESQLSSLGSNLLVLRPSAVRVQGVTQESGTTTRLTMADVEALQENIPSISKIAPSVNDRGQVTYLNKNWNTQVLATTPAYAAMRASEPQIGRFFTEEENKKRARVAVLGVTVVKELFGDENPMGAWIKINKINFQVIGVLPQKGASAWRDQDDTIIVPLLTGMYRLFGKNYIESIDIEVRDAEEIDATQIAMTDLMHARHRVAPSQQNGAFQIRNLADIQAALTESSRTMSWLLAAIAAISLLVGGIGIMNIMLVSVTERTKEIGVRKAVGARKNDILLQFLAESVVVSVVGGIIGIISGWLLTEILARVADWSTSVSWQSILLAFSFSALIGIVFGVYPARKASNLHPIEALRYE